MARFSLIRHPDGASPVRSIDVNATWFGRARLRLDYHVAGDLDALAIPAPAHAVRTDELWKHSCFEAFIGAPDGYYEFNFSPSSRWAAYRFDTYREGMRDAPIADPAVTWSAEEGRAILSVTLALPPNVAGPMGLSAVIEDKQGVRSFWALAHPEGPPDFHEAACFTAELPPAG